MKDISGEYIEKNNWKDQENFLLHYMSVYMPVVGAE